jgi:F0F1-type ATP synthase membrane subunit b/b'
MGGFSMASYELKNGIESLESQAEAVLAEARTKATEMLRTANQEAARILSAPLRLEGVEAECAAIVDAALEQSRVAVDKAEKEAELLKASVRGEGAKTLQALVKKIESMVRGAH